MSPIHSSSSSSSGCLSLRLTMGALNAFVVAVVTSITLAITLTLSLQALRSIGATQVASVAQSTSYRIGDYFNRPVTLANGINNYSRTRIWPTNMSLVDYNGTWSRWTDVIMNVYFANKNVGEVQFIFADGSRIGFLSSTNYNGLFIKQSLVLAPNGSLLMDYLWYNASTLAVLPKTCPPYRNDFTPPADPREGILPILTSGTVNGRISPWLQPTILVLAGGSVGYYASYISAAHDANGTVLAYGVYTLRIENVNEYLAEIKSTPNTHAFVVDPDGYLFASNYPAPIAVLTFNVSSNNTLGKGCSSALTTLSAQSTAVKRTVSCRASMFDYPYKPLNALAQPTVTTDAASPEVSLISVDQENYYTVAKHIVFDGVGPPLFMILIMPESDVIGNVVTGRNVAIGVCAGVFILVAVAVFAIITRLLSPLSQISARMMRASALEDDDDDADLSSFAEVRELQEAYLGMNSELRRIRSFVPQSLLMSRVSASANRNSIVEVNNIDDLGVDTEAAAAPPPSPRGAEHRPPVNVSSAGNSAKDNSVVDTPQQASVASSLRRRRASRQRKVTFDPSVMSQLQASIGIRIEHVSVLAADLGDFHNTCRLLQPQEIELRMQGTVDFVYSLVTHHGGVLERFNGDHFMATFNGAKRCGEHTIRAVSAALQLSTHVQPDAFQLTWRIGVASGRSFVGNLGSDQVRAFNVVGSAMTHATALQRIAKMYRRKTVLIPQRVFSEVSTQHDVRPLDIVCLPGGGKPVVIGEVSFRPESRTEAPEQDANGFTDKRPTAAATSTPPLARSAPNADWLYQADQSASPNRLPLLLKFFACVSDQRSGAAKRYLELLGLSFGEDGQALAPSPFTDRDNSSDYTPQKEAAALPPIDDAPAVLERSTSFHVPNHAQLLRWEVLEFLRYSDVLPPRTTPPTSDTDGDEGDESVDTLPSDFRRPQPRLPSTASRQELESWYLYTPTSIILQFLASKMPRVPLLHGLLEEAIADKVGQHMGPFYDWVVASAPFHHSNS